MEEYWSGLVSCAVVAGAFAPRATVAGAPGAAREGVERVEAFGNIDIPCPGQDRANFPYQLSAPDSVEAVAGVFLLPVAVVGTVGRVVVAVAGEEDTSKIVAQPVVAAPLCLEVPARIASHSSPVAFLVSVLVVAGVVVVLRFPLCLLYRSMFNQCLSDCYLLFFNRSDLKDCGSGLFVKHIIIRVFWLEWVDFMSGSVNYRENASVADHAMRISGGRKDNSQPLLFQVFQVFHCFNCFRCARYFGVDSAHVARYFFGIAELMLMLVGGVDAVAGSHLGSWMILFLFVFLFAGQRRGYELSANRKSAC
jgi:hypothetical protein